MPNEFLRQLDRWLDAVLQEKTAGIGSAHLCPADLSCMISEYILSRIAQDPGSCGTGCGLDEATDADILTATTFDEEMLAAAFIGAMDELGNWHDDDGVAFMIEQGVPPDDAETVAGSAEVVAGKLGVRGRALIRGLSRRPASQEPASSAAEPMLASAEELRRDVAVEDRRDPALEPEFRREHGPELNATNSRRRRARPPRKSFAV